MVVSHQLSVKKGEPLDDSDSPPNITLAKTECRPLFQKMRRSQWVRVRPDTLPSALMQLRVGHRRNRRPSHHRRVVRRLAEFETL